MNEIHRAAGLLAAARHVAVLTGAGISAESGIPTFRGAGGFWRGRDPLTLATPEAFETDPALVWDFYHYRRALVAAASPNPAHQALVELADLVPRLSLITQNVDRLQQRAGSREVIELHGNIWEIRCSRCGHLEGKGVEPLPPLPTCDDCGGLMRPGVVWFGESLPPDAWLAAEEAVADAEVTLVVGTSAVVYPAAGLITRHRPEGHCVIEINLEPTPASDVVALGIYGPAGSIMPKLIERLRRSRG